MAMGKRVAEGQESFWIATADLPSAPGHPFYERLNKILHVDDFDRFVETRCRKFYAARMGRPSLAPAVYFRLLLIGYFEGIDSERGIAWRVADSMALRRFVGYALTDSTADHSTISRTRRLIDLPARRVDRAELCPLLRHGRDASHASSRAREHLETAAGSRSRFQSEFGDASGDGIRHPAWVAGPLGFSARPVRLSMDASTSWENPSRDPCVDPA